jgi:hypothetical protein
MFNGTLAKGINPTNATQSPKLRATSISGFLLLAALVLVGFQAAGAAGSQASATGSNNTATLPVGTRLMVKMVDSVDSETSQPDQRFRGTLEANLMAGDVVVAPKGTTVFGRLLTAQSAGRSGGRLEFDLTDIVLNGQTYSLSTSSHEVQGGGAGSQAGTGAKAGAAIGALGGGLGGAMRGAGTGAVVGHATGANTQGETVKVPAGTLLEFTLDHPVSLPATGK